MNFTENGFEILKNFISQEWIGNLIYEINRVGFHKETGGVRNINKKLKIIGEYLASEEFKGKSDSFLPASVRLVRAMLFNKSAESNWYVTWHQDRTVCVSSRFEETGWSIWSVKENMLHVQPPLEVLKNMVTLRIHLDSASNENGCLKVIPNSHTLGILPAEVIANKIASNEIYFCEVDAGDALIMRPLLLHASNKSVAPSNRRVLHFEFSDWPLPEGVYWG
ncbi:MAG: hypothetical protein EOO52_07155 [Gammaproteobacteria bacterium]|nr:MAG: hypothetical protein EOO52_07155 [Gammaproteobacteria bacterium]